MRTKRCPKIRRLLLTTIALVMLLSSAVMAKNITLKYNKSYKLYYATYKATKNETLYFVMPVKYNGLIDVTGCEISPYGNRWGISTTMYNARGYRLDYYSSNYVNINNESYERYAVTPGYYYFKVKATKGYTYVFGVGYVPKTGGAPKGGTSKGRAYTLTRGRAATSIISAASYKCPRWFKFYVPKTGYGVKLRVQNNGGQGPITVYVAGPNLSSTKKYTVSPRYYQDLSMYQTVYGSRYYRTGPKPGWYYVLVSKGTGNYKYASSQFAIKWSYYRP